MDGNDSNLRHEQIDPAPERASLSTRQRQLVAAGLILIAIAAAVWYLQKSPILTWDFRNNIWIPARLLVSGQSPYRVELLNEAGSAVWLPAIIGISFPLGWLDYPVASNLWFLVSLAALSAIIALLAMKDRPSVPIIAAIAVMAAAFPPTITHLRLGQFTILATLLFLAVAWLKERLPLPIAALILALALSKPQLGVLAASGLLVVYYREDGRKTALQLLGLLGLWIALLTIPLFFADPDWIADFVAALLKNPVWEHPSMWVLLPRQLGPAGLWFWIGLVLMLGIADIWLWLTRSREDAMLWSLALTPLVTPYIWSWDFVMVMPLFAATAMESKSRLQLTVLVLGYLLCWLIVWQIATSGDVNNIRYWWVPWFMILIVLAARFAGDLRRKRAVPLPVNGL